ncbi:transcription termination factor NusA [Rickettsiales endosymbiont of Stachyamoeba lipophora]|uniref:transcription termination factor NusA n=1 Tax=Rickettsiales endosymbiont of Stachyamoeba lipophora TaxID=2486578 RepID=UPI000F6458C4|nr:transcription termination factor NusA [Rickettsiales endosymbiont of Stachyamoeba lipophora]AZL15959.1 transcription termination/antitermination protein NusA [Rickettsiales endosymbiont of Stachyamoeba lipophora]
MMKGDYFEKMQMFKAVAADTQLTLDQILDAVAHAMMVASRKKYGKELDIKVDISRKTGEGTIYRVQTVVETVTNPIVEISLEDALHKKPDAKIGDQIIEQLPPIDLGRVAAQSAKNDLVNTIRDAIRTKQYEEYVGRKGEIIFGVVKRVENRSLIIDIGRAEAIITQDKLIPNEVYKNGDRIKAYIEDILKNNKGPQIFLSRTHPQFLVKLFAQEVPEIYDGVIQIKSVAREPGSRAKISVFSKDDGIDPVGSCVGIRGSRVQAVINELQGEKIDIIPFSEDPAKFVISALSPAAVSKVVIDEEKHKIDVILPTEQLSLAIGRKGQNVRLAAQLTGWNIDVVTDEEDSKRRFEEFNSLTKLFTEALDVDELIAQLLSVEGFTTIEEVALVDLSELVAIEGFDEQLAQALQERAKVYLDEQQAVMINKWKKLGVAPALAKIEGFNPQILVNMGENNIKTMQDLADLSRDEFLEICPNASLSDEQIDQIIMDARAQVGE